MFIQTKNKKAVSVMIGYILLITFAVVISVAVYSWLKTYVPKEGIECPSDVSIYISDWSNNTNNLSLTFQNNGKFDIGGIYIRYSTDKNQTIASEDLSILFNGNNNDAIKLNPGLKFGNGEGNLFGIGNETTLTFNITDINKIYAIDIIPIRWQENQKQVVSCTNSKTTKIIDWTMTGSPIVIQQGNTNVVVGQRSG